MSSRSEPDSMVRLREAVDALTQPSYVWAERDSGPHERVPQEPLLVQLEAAIREAMASTQGDQTSKHTRGIIDGDALYLFTRISSQISDWAFAVGAPHRGSPVELLRSWFVAWCQSIRGDAEDAFRTAVLRKWEASIRAKLDPLDEKILPDPCPNPECVQGFDEHTGRPVWWDRATREARLFPLVVSYRRDDGPQMVERARVRCRACGASWSARELQWVLERMQEAESA
jgi:hypothetical protein